MILLNVQIRNLIIYNVCPLQHYLTSLNNFDYLIKKIKLGH